MDWSPLEDEYEDYCRQLEEAAIEGQLQDEDTAKKVGYPKKLHLSDLEKDMLVEFVGNRTSEALEHFQAMGGVHPAVVGQALLNAAVAAMMWERERIGR
jgi:hypothetical protein